MSNNNLSLQMFDVGLDYMTTAARAGDVPSMLYLAKAHDTGLNLGSDRKVCDLWARLAQLKPKFKTLKKKLQKKHLKVGVLLFFLSIFHCKSPCLLTKFVFIISRHLWNMNPVLNPSLYCSISPQHYGIFLLWYTCLMSLFTSPDRFSLFIKIEYF